jgi:murein DD-endopeptidase MepM/ murein hydrolase activator NlpD
MVVGTPVYASEAGIVDFVGSVPNQAGKDLSGFGLFVRIKHADGSLSYYAHLSSAVAVAGLNVTKGQLITQEIAVRQKTPRTFISR